MLVTRFTTHLLASLFIAVALTLTACGEAPREEPPVLERDIAWEIHAVEDISYGPHGNVRRFRYSVVIHEPVQPDEVEAIGEQVIAKAKEDTPFNALVAEFYDYPELAQGVHTLGTLLMAPNGEIGDADAVRTGDYGAMERVWDIKEKNWDDRLTPDEVRVWARVEELVWEDPTTEVDDDEVLQRVAVEFNMTIDEVNAILRKQVSWAFQDISADSQSE